MTDTPDYRSTVFLPTTSFPMRGELPAREPEMLRRWERIGLWGRVKAAMAGRPRFVLHDGPIYSNGNLHIGHALNRILKDVIMRAHRMAGRGRAVYPGLGHARAADRVEGGGGVPRGRAATRTRSRCCSFARRVPALLAALARGADGGVPAARRGGRLGGAVRDVRLRLGGGDRGGDRQVPAERRAVSRAAAGDVEPGGEDRAGRGGDRIPRPQERHGVRALPGGDGPAIRFSRALRW